jgi:hypothetical protein
MQFTVKYIVAASGGPTDCSSIPASDSRWQTGEPADGANVKCVYVTGLALKPHGKANVDVNLQTVLAAKGNSGWAANAQNLFRAGFPFRSSSTITLDSDFGLKCKPPNSNTNCTDPKGFNAAYAGKSFSGAQALGLVFAGKQVTAIGGYSFDQNAFGISNALVTLWNSNPGTPSAVCQPGDPSTWSGPHPVAWANTQNDGFYFIENQGFNDVTPPNPDPNSLPFNVTYYMLICNASKAPSVNWPARSEGQKLGNRQFDEQDFFISPTTSVIFTKQPVNTKSINSFPVSAQLQDAFGQPVTNDTSTQILLTANQNNGSMTCTPANPQAQTAGVANFSCKISVIANSYQLTASAPSLKASTSNLFNITK